MATRNSQGELVFTQGEVDQIQIFLKGISSLRIYYQI